MKLKDRRRSRVAAVLFMLSLNLACARGNQVKLGAELANPVMKADIKQLNYLRVSLTGFDLKGKVDRTPANVAIVLDRSGSMQGKKIEQARRGAIEAIRCLRSDDIISIVTYSSTVEVVVPATKLSDRESIIKKINEIRTDGNTALFAGVSKGVAEVRKFLDRNRINRVVLLSDGLANSGPSSPAELGSLGASLIKDGISVTTLGLGSGYNEDLMTSLASKSDGNHLFVESADSLAKTFALEFGAGLEVIAQSVEVRINCAEGIRPVRLMGMDGQISGQTVTVPVHQLYANQERYIMLEIEIPAGTENVSRSIASVDLSYNNMETKNKDKLNSMLTARFSRDEEKIKEVESREVMVSVVEQIANERNKMAVTLRDSGKVEEAKKVLKSNIDYLTTNWKRFDSEELRQQKAENYDDISNMTSDYDYKVQRKRMRDRQDNRARRPQF